MLELRMDTVLAVPWYFLCGRRGQRVCACDEADKMSVAVMVIARLAVHGDEVIALEAAKRRFHSGRQ
jgi:hypothetical protein